ncbi:endonuclease dU [Halodesulfurarchaeum formicicum]|uniref:UPF0215 protein HSR6_1966 n=1 Tax=Halodesulfurarchaeum formicicum TaxID=1873524 RepID=A0A1J1AEQ1_9EURY|nr:DUF99 family protein [Halodesulfurarchaeum formicicum]APE96397.1 hypothetical protein HSR6_1966 [Halodesulfurarchaeum formicicum]
MKPGVRALGVAESYERDQSVLGGAVVTPSRTVDGFAFETCRVGGLDATDAVIELYSTLDREDVQYLFLAGIAPAWYNILDLRAIHRAVDRPVLSVSFEASPGLEPALRAAFEGSELTRRLDRYRAQPERVAVTVNEQTRYVRSVGLSDAPETVMTAFTPTGGRPEPLRVARLAARGVDRFRREEQRGGTDESGR